MDKYRQLLSSTYDGLARPEWGERADDINVFVNFDEMKELNKSITKFDGDARCRKCHQIPINVGDKFRAPKQNDVKLWNEIKSMTAEEQTMLFANYCPFDSGHIRNKKNFYVPLRSRTRGDTTYAILYREYRSDTKC